MKVSNYSSTPRLYLSTSRCIYMIGIVAIGIILIFNSSIAYAKSSMYLSVVPCQNPPQPQPDSNSLLVVLLDRSGSLVAQQSPTDPDLYSTSVTRALADLWPGKMAVIAFNTIQTSAGEQVQLKTLGPFNVGGSNSDHQTMKQEIQALPLPHLGTPTGPAMDKALSIIESANAPLARVVLITDGSPGYHSPDPNVSDPDGSKEENYINSQLLQKFCAASVPIDTIALNTDDAASTFLHGISTGTGGTYRRVIDPRDLSSAVLNLDGQWQRNRNYQELQLQLDNTYHVSIGQLARTLHLFVFRSNDSYSVTVKDPGGQPISTTEDASDKHYVLETLNFPVPVQTGDYTVSVKDSSGTFDSGALVYSFVDSALQVQLLTPTATTQIAVDQPFTVRTWLVVNQRPLPQLQEKATIAAYLIYTVSGQLHTESITLQSQGLQNQFTGHITAPAQLVPLHILVIVNYEGVPAETDITMQEVCGFSIPCLVQQYWIVLVIALPILLLLLAILILWLLWRQQPAPFGVLSTVPSPRRRRRGDEDDEASVALRAVEESHPFMQRVFHRSILTSSEIEKHRDASGNFDFDLASFDLVFMKGGEVELVSTSVEPIVIKHDGGASEELEKGKSIRLETGDIIAVADKNRAIFSKN